MSVPSANVPQMCDYADPPSLLDGTTNKPAIQTWWLTTNFFRLVCISLICLMLFVQQTEPPARKSTADLDANGIEKETVFYGFRRVGNRIVGTNDHLRTHRLPRKRRKDDDAPLTGEEIFDLLITQETRDQIDIDDRRRGVRWTMPTPPNGDNDDDKPKDAKDDSIKPKVAKKPKKKRAVPPASPVSVDDYAKLGIDIPDDIRPRNQSAKQLLCGYAMRSTPYDNFFLRAEYRDAIIEATAPIIYPSKPTVSLSKSTSRRPGDPTAAYAFIRFYVKEDDLNIDRLETRIRDYLKRKKTKSPSKWFSYRALHTIGDFWRLNGDMSKALKCYRLALIWKPNSNGVLNSFTRLLLHLRLDADAEQLARHSLRLAPSCRWPHLFTLAQCGKHSKRVKQSMRLAHRALEQHPHHVLLHRLLFELEEERTQNFAWYFRTLWSTSFYSGLAAIMRSLVWIALGI